tara:strand:- start:90 stop:422 length:333 start_codon:yes stop_codon:yes gene_type:complete
MDKISPKMAAAFGMGFIGFIFAAYSYNQQHKEEYKDALPDFVMDEKLKYNPIDKDEKDTELDKDLEKDLEKNKDSEETSSFIDKTKQTWGQFWKGEYENMRSEENEKKIK